MSASQSVRQGRGSGRIAFWIGALGYLLLSIRQPPEWSLAVWAALAFVLVPVVVGYAAGRGQAGSLPPRARFAVGFWAAAKAMFCYTLISLLVTRARMHSPADQLQLTAVVLVVSSAYALLAGIVAGLAGAWLAGRGYRPSPLGGRP